MARGTIKVPEIRGFLLSGSFDDLFSNYGNGIFSLNTGSNEPTAPTSNSYWMVLQFKMWASGGWYGGQFAINTASSTIYYMRKHRGSNGWTAWKSLTFG